MISKKTEIINKNNKEKDSQFNSIISNKPLKRLNKNIYDIPLTTAMSSFLLELRAKQKIMQNEINYHRSVILEADKKSNIYSTKHFPLIESRYSIKNLSNKNYNEIFIKRENQMTKSKSEVRINFDTKNLNKNIFQTSIDNMAKSTKINQNKISSPILSLFNNSKSTNKSNIIGEDFYIKNKNILSSSSSTKLINNGNSSINKLNNNKDMIRKKKFKVDVIKGWEFKNQFNTNNSKDKSFVEDKTYQKNLISNEIEIIIDSTNIFKLKNANVLEVHIKNNDINLEFLIKLNKLIEETAGLYNEIAHLIIKDYESYINYEINKEPLNPPEMIDEAKVFDEKIEFNKNIKILNEALKFLLVAYEVYLILNNTSEYKLPAKNLIRVRHFLSRARYNINSLNANAKKYLEIIEFEKKLVDLYNKQKKLIENDEKIGNNQYYSLNKPENDGFENFREKVNKDYGAEKIRRLNNLLNTPKISINNRNYKKTKDLKYIDFNDKMFNTIFRYLDPGIKDKFEAYSVTQKNHKDKFVRKVYKFNY